MAEQNNNQQQDVNQLLKVRYDKLHELQENGKDPFVITKYDVTNHSTDVKEHFEEMEGKEVSLAGRMMFKRVMGKASFCNIQDLKGRIQIYVARDSIGEESYADFKKYDVGDILGARKSQEIPRLRQLPRPVPGILLPHIFHAARTPDGSGVPDHNLLS